MVNIAFFVIAVGQAAAAPVTIFVQGGTADSFAAPPEPASPNGNLIAHSPYGRGLFYFDPIPGVTPGFSSDLVLLHTFVMPPGEILGGTITMRVRAGAGKVENDSLALGFADIDRFRQRYSRTFGDTPNGPGLTAETWDTGDEALFVLYLKYLPTPSGSTIDVLSEMSRRRYLDFIVQDETGVDFVKLELDIRPPSQGDFNRDGVVDTADYPLWRKQFGTAVTPYGGADADGNGSVDAFDYEIWRNNLGFVLVNQAGTATIAVPESASVLLLCAGILSLVARRVRFRRR